MDRPRFLDQHAGDGHALTLPVREPSPPGGAVNRRGRQRPATDSERGDDVDPALVQIRIICDEAVTLLVRSFPDYSRTAGLVRQESVPAPGEAEECCSVA